MQKTATQIRQEFLDEVAESARRFRDAKRAHDRDPGGTKDQGHNLRYAERELFRVVDKFEWWTQYGRTPKDPEETQ